jgi:FlaA1/EpsC-like NDP-sugar epimerase
MRRRLSSAALPVHRYSLIQVVADGCLVALAYLLAFGVEFGGLPHGDTARYGPLLSDTIYWVVPLAVVVLAGFGAYSRLWTYIGQRDYIAVIKSAVVVTVLITGAIAVLHPVVYHPQIGRATAVTLPSRVVALFLLSSAALLVGARFAVQSVREGRIGSFRSAKGAREVLIVGAGEGGRLVVRELVRNADLGLHPVGYVDDDPLKQRMKDEHGLRVLGTTAPEDLARVLDETEPDELVIAIPSAPGTLRAAVVTEARKRGIPVRTMPTVFELLQDSGGRLQVTRQLRQVQLEDMLGRESVTMDLERVGRYLAGRVVMVTGAGGSIGSELCRQIARVAPSKLVLVDHAEDNLFEITRELQDERHVQIAVPVLGDCKEDERMREVLSEHRPTIVFHAAAYKHVAMMEQNPIEAIRNNSLATRLMARLAGELGVKTFVLVSTDKAVRPATVMGASKALAEWAVEAAAARFPETSYATVRFGNVLGSSGSVVPIFRRQIAAGGPVTVTDERMQRYFMTIPEAVQLVIRSGSLVQRSWAGADGDKPPSGSTGRSGDVFVLEMGEPVKIVDLAETMIRLSGFEPGKDIAIEFIGHRSGEKFDEELFNVYERPQPTVAQRIVRAEREAPDASWYESIFDEINLFVLEGDVAALAAHVAELDATRLAAAASSARTAP